MAYGRPRRMTFLQARNALNIVDEVSRDSSDDSPADEDNPEDNAEDLSTMDIENQSAILVPLPT